MQPLDDMSMLGLTHKAFVEHVEDKHLWRDWRVKSLSMRSTLGLSPLYKPLTAMGYSFANISMNHDRIRELLEIAYGSIHPSDRANIKHNGFYVDVSQCVTRRKWGHHIKTLCTSHLLYDVPGERFCTGRDSLTLQGVPVEISSGSTSESKLRELAGEGMFAPSVATMMLALVLNPLSPWWATEPAAKRLRQV